MGEDGRVPTMTTDQRPVRPADAVLAAAVDLARRAAEEDSSAGQVGAHRGCQPIAEQDPSAPVAAHLFECTSPSYVGWHWWVSLTRLYDEDRVTVDEVALLPGETALLPPQWVPWSERLRPGDLGVGDVLPTAPDDERLVPAYVATGDPAVDDVAHELGFGRVRVMSRLGRVEAAERWNEGLTGPDSAAARQAPGACGTCGFYLPVEGSLRAMFGVCGNEYSPSDSRVVATGYGCGAHSEAATEPDSEPLSVMTYDTQDYDVLEQPEPDSSPST